ncbi:MAG: Hemerythrin HHE cation binding domain protein [Actinobacteria bacterium ADurb.Bin346]|nr:MAG: Hemerythrin HHE cation binding domain protein [Actinobacteria bacterium ADurb.Bin346]
MSEMKKLNADKKEIIKSIIQKLHKGLSVEDAKKKFDEEAGSITSSEIAEVEQSLINEGMSVDEIKKFCNVHALLFESSLSQAMKKEESPGHPVNTFKLENRQIEKLTDSLKKVTEDVGAKDPVKIIKEIKDLLIDLKEIEHHYVRKEQLLFPLLERYGFMGPSKVMWGKHNEIRELLKNALTDADKEQAFKNPKAYINDYVAPLIEEVDGMIFKEENILFPASMEKLKPEDWVEILKESDDIGYTFIEKPAQTSAIIEDIKRNVVQEPEITAKEEVKLPTGILKLKELMWMLNSLPVDLTFIDKDDTVRYFSDNKERIFVRTKSIIGRKVQNCHPPQSVDAVEKILAAFKAGKKDHADYWINFNEKFVFIRFIAIRDESANYLGTVELTMDIAGLRSLQGEKRLLDEKDLT